MSFLIVIKYEWLYQIDIMLVKKVFLKVFMKNPLSFFLCINISNKDIN